MKLVVARCPGLPKITISYTFRLSMAIEFPGPIIFLGEDIGEVPSGGEAVFIAADEIMKN
jgi:hypothetical protein